MSRTNHDEEEGTTTVQFRVRLDIFEELSKMATEAADLGVGAYCRRIMTQHARAHQAPAAAARKGKR